LTAVFGRHLPAVLRCLSTRLSALPKAAKIWRASLIAVLNKHYLPPPLHPYLQKWRNLLPLKTAGSLPRGSFQVENESLWLFNILLPRYKMYIFQLLRPRLKSLFSILHSALHISSTSSLIHYSAISHSTEPLTLCNCPQSSFFFAVSITLQRS
jgi:hypothetical protein